MAWYLNGTRVYVEEDTGWQGGPRVGKLDVLDSKQTIIHDAGRPSYTRTIQFVVFSGYEASILPIIDSASGINLTSDQGSQGDVVVENLKPKRVLDISRTTPVYRITADLIKDGV